MKLGFTGTGLGMATKQFEQLAYAVAYFDPAEAHHGDCIGADAQFHDLVKNGNLWIVIHPPDNPRKRAFKQGDLWWEEKPYLNRNRDIVKCSDVLIAAPAEFHEIVRSGTWATVRYARQKGIPIYIIFPDGSVRKEEGRDSGNLFHV